MTDRWSNPSGGLGIDRFRVWPAGTDSYDHLELTSNFDTLDGILGIPSSGNWPPSTGVNGGIFKEVKLLELNRLYIGACFPWFRPSASLAIPNGCEIMDGRTILAADHDFTGIATSITLPDMRHAFVLGADAAKDNGTNAAAVGAAGIDSVSGAPGPQATGGSNQVSLTIPTIPPHDHGGGDHTHTIDRQIIQLPTGGANYIINVRDTVTHTDVTNPSGTIIDSEGDGLPHENRPRWVGLIWLCKVRHIDTL